MRDDVWRCCPVYSTVSHKRSFFSFSVGYDFVGHFMMWMIIFLSGKGVGLLTPNNLCTLKNTNPRCACASKMPMVKTAAFSRETFQRNFGNYWHFYCWCYDQFLFGYYIRPGFCCITVPSTETGYTALVFFFLTKQFSQSCKLKGKAQCFSLWQTHWCNDWLQLLVFYALSKTRCPQLSGLCNNILQFMKNSL